MNRLWVIIPKRIEIVRKIADGFALMNFYLTDGQSVCPHFGDPTIFQHDGGMADIRLRKPRDSFTDPCVSCFENNYVTRLDIAHHFLTPISLNKEMPTSFFRHRIIVHANRENTTRRLIQ